MTFFVFTAHVQLPPAKHVKYATDDGNISPQSSSGAPISTTHTLLLIMTSFHQVLEMCCKGPQHFIHPLPEGHR